MRNVFSARNEFMADPYFKDLKTYYDLNSKILKWSSFTLLLLIGFVFYTRLDFAANTINKNVLLMWVIDLFIVMFFTLLHLITRALIINTSLLFIYNIINKYDDKVIKYKKLKSLVEQIYYFIYFTVMTLFGYFIFYQSFMVKGNLNLEDVWFEVRKIFVPHSINSSLAQISKTSFANYNSVVLNLYYLIQISAYLYQLIYILLNLETKRKDHTQMIIHHVVTLILTVGSYTCSLNNFGFKSNDDMAYGIENLKYVGHLIMMTTDTTDLFLSLSKILNYLVVLPFDELRIKERTSKMFKKVISNVCDAVFLLGFVVSWVLGRHLLYNVVVYNSFSKLIPSMHRELSEKSPEILGYGNKHLIWVTALISLLLCLQSLQIIWFVVILKLVIRVVNKKIKSLQKKEVEDDIVDSRSDDEDEVPEEKIMHKHIKISSSTESLLYNKKKLPNNNIYISINESSDTLTNEPCK
ncbi:Sphingosine N-acyltransferase lag1 [Hanseniaspora opuntiae]|uniref:Sphingosine N-acyltransferase lag1 n=1 Tax=Hanseniaspora opuntiae TaxID=211096 RepID=A0A1E5RMM9_9ASCO|nr:Sphingosine N-acyltransferase lag1 [Hanseniaspora opuntiae]